uniref:Uncharacterized protein n=1 Tax=Tanacetum cinerariifolium TaxID=118510 RepID=A0A6L2JQX4_TANCI|nr:hypothetical protein [Tanacetum cinerariifolium]
MQLIQKLQDVKKCMKKVEPSSRSKAINDIISIESFMEALVLNHYVLVRKILRMILEPGNLNLKVPVADTFHEQTSKELTKKEVKQIEADDQAIRTIIMGLPEDIYAAIYSCEIAQEIWLHVQ